MWLDDLESCLGPDGLEPALLAEIVRLRIPVLATMRHQQFDIFAAPETASDAGTEHARTATAGARVLRQLDPVELSMAPTMAEGQGGQKGTEVSRDGPREERGCHCQGHGLVTEESFMG